MRDKASMCVYAAFLSNCERLNLAMYSNLVWYLWQRNELAVGFKVAKCKTESINRLDLSNYISHIMNVMIGYSKEIYAFDV